MKKLLVTLMFFVAILFFVATSYAGSMLTNDPSTKVNFLSDNTRHAHTFNISKSNDSNLQAMPSAVPEMKLYVDNKDPAGEPFELANVIIDGVRKGTRGLENTNELSNDINEPSLLGPNKGDHEPNLRPRPLEKDPVNDKPEPNVETQNNSQGPVPSIVWLFGLGLIALLVLKRRPMKNQPDSTIGGYLR